jgi:tetratricopeptide (TPR) repeat protein
MGYLSFQSYRHGIFFIFSALAISIYQLRYVKKYQDWISRWVSKPLWAGGASVVLLLVMAWYVQYRNISELQREGYSGYGSFSQAQDAYPFLEKAKISGRMFNTYSIGDYLLYRGYPDRKVYIDGRNIDYGYDFLYKTGLAGFNPEVWDELEKKYNFTYAVIDYPIAPGAPPENDLPYVAHLNNNKNWTLVYLDDWIAIYLKHTKENDSVIKEYGYSAITPESIEFGSAFQKEMSEDLMKKVEQELERVTKNSKRSIKARLTLAHHYVDIGEYEKAQAFANEAISAQSYRPEVYEALGLVAVGAQNYRDAGALFEQSIKRTGGVGPSIDYAYLASIFSKAGDISKASYYHQKAK